MAQFRVGRATHERQQLTFVVVEHKQLLGQCRLVVEHVHQQTHGTQVVAQLLERTCLASQGFVDLGVQNLLDHGAHVRDGVHCLLKSQHRQHTPHLCKLRDGHVQAAFLLWGAKELIERFFNVSQRYLELAHDTAHGLTIAHTPVELLHPRVQRLRWLARQHSLKPVGQGLGALGELGCAGIKILKGGFQVQRCGGYFHGQFRAQAAGLTHRMVRRLHQCLCQHCAGWVQLEQRVADQPKLVGHLARAAGITTREQGPGFLGRIDAFASLRKHRRVVAAQGGHVVVGRRDRAQAEGLADCRELRRLLDGYVPGLRAEK